MRGYCCCSNFIYQFISKLIIKMVLGLKKSQAFCLGLVAVAYYYKITFSQDLSDGPIVETQLGKVQGRTLFSRGGRTFYAYMNIPYAKPPLGNRRFEPPEPTDPWPEDILDGTDYGPRCMQFDSFMAVIQGSEDCLTLNVFTPVQTRSISKPLPVIVYIHGGFFHNGGSDIFRSDYFMDEEVVLVTFNYRLAALGFLNTGDGVIRGNMGLKDQTLALRWIQENIGDFGGDSAKVTLLGESAGAVAAHLHLFSPMSKGLFSSAISQSGSVHHFWAINSQSKQQSKRFAKIVGCERNDTVSMKECLQSLPAEALAAGHTELLDPLRESIAIFKPSVELDIPDGNTFLSEAPGTLVERGAFTRVPWITGVNSDEGLIFSAAMLVNKTMQMVAMENWDHYVDRTLWLSTDDRLHQDPKMTEKIRHYYFGEQQKQDSLNTSLSTTTAINMDPLEKLSSYTNMISDRGFFYDTHKGAIVQSKFASVYLYYYTYRGEYSVVHLMTEIWGILNRQLEVTLSVVSTWVTKYVFGRALQNYGASHSDELSMLFYMPWVSEIYQDSPDFQMSIDLVKLWVDFAHDPLSPKFRNIEWPAVNATQHPLKYMKIDSEPGIIDEPFTHRLEFWNSLLK